MRWAAVTLCVLAGSALGVTATLHSAWAPPAAAQGSGLSRNQLSAPITVDPITVSETGPASTATPAPATAMSPVQTAIDPAAPQPLLTAQAIPQTAASGRPDETALRYFAQQGDTVRLQREIERLRALYPDWQPPADPLANDFVPDPTIVRIWDLVTAGDYAGARAAISEKQAADPGFVPTADLTETIARGETGTRLRDASDAGQYDEVISIAANAPQLLTCASVDNLWRLAEAFIKTSARQRGIDAYSYILSNCTDAGERFATLQKAIDLLDRADLVPLLALEKDGEFTSLRLDLARRAVAAALEKGGTTPSPADIDLLSKSAQAEKSAEDLRLLGYFELNRNRPNEARRFFEAALSADPSAASAQGLGVALVQLNDPAAAEAVLADHRDDNEDIAKVYRDAAAATLAREPRLAVSETILGRIVETAIATRDAGLAQELGWYAYAFSQPQTALEWFETALSWQSDLEPAAYGLMVAANALGDAVRVEEIRRSWGGRSLRIAQFGNLSSVSTPNSAVPLPKPRPAHLTQVQTVRQQAPRQVQQAESPSGGGGGGGCRTYRPPNSLSPGGALTHAWCLMDLNRPAQAVDHFGRALDSASEATRSDAAYGRALAYIRLGLADEAAVAAAAAPLTNKRAVELQIAILTLKATSAYNAGNYQLALAVLDARSGFAAERNDLLTLRAWSYYHLRRFREAERIFEAVAATGYGDAVSGLEASRSFLRSQQNQ